MPEVSLLELFGIFFYVGLFTIGGGLVAITIMQQTIVERGLVSQDLFYNMVAISESTPGPVGINMATYLGFNFYGIPGAIVTTFAEVLPSLICIIIIAKLLSSFQDNRITKSVFKILRPAATGLIFVAVIKVYTLCLINVPTDLSVLTNAKGWAETFNILNIIFFATMTTLSIKTKIHPIYIIVCGAIYGAIYFK